MRSNKCHTKQAFTEHVGREAKMHTLRNAREPAVCADCGNVYADGRWRKPGPARDGAKQPHFRAAQTTLCPDCKVIRGAQPRGYVTLSGEFVGAHREEIEELLINVAVAVKERNPVARITGWDESKADELTVTTTTPRLARRLGHALRKAYEGDVRYDFSHGNKLAHVWWRRD
jgi:hypothetical protein